MVHLSIKNVHKLMAHQFTAGVPAAYAWPWFPMPVQIPWNIKSNQLLRREPKSTLMVRMDTTAWKAAVTAMSGHYRVTMDIKLVNGYR